jgi:alkyl hydroperoxide reductase subunit AhpC
VGESLVVCCRRNFSRAGLFRAFGKAQVYRGKAEVIRRYDLLHRGAGPKGTDIARPAEFLIDPSGTIRWVNLTENIAVRARPEQVLKAFDEMQAKAGP